MRHYAAAEKCIHAMPRAIEELVRDHEIQRLVFFLQRSDCGNRNDSLDSKLFEPVNVGAKIQLARQNAVSAAVPRQKRHLATLERAANVGVGRRAKRRFHTHFFHPLSPGMA